MDQLEFVGLRNLTKQSHILKCKYRLSKHCSKVSTDSEERNPPKQNPAHSLVLRVRGPLLATYPQLRPKTRPHSPNPAPPFRREPVYPDLWILHLKSGYRLKTYSSSRLTVLQVRAGLGRHGYFTSAPCYNFKQLGLNGSLSDGRSWALG